MICFLFCCVHEFSHFSSGQDHLLPEAEEITMISIQLAARFLFTTGFHTKKIVRGPASDWYIYILTMTTVLTICFSLRDFNIMNIMLTKLFEESALFIL